MCHAGFSIPTPTVTYTPPPDKVPVTTYNDDYHAPEARQLQDIRDSRIKEEMSLYQRVLKFFRDRAKEGDW